MLQRNPVKSRRVLSAWQGLRMHANLPGLIIGALCLACIVGSWLGAEWLARHLVLERMSEEARLWQSRTQSLLHDNRKAFETGQLSEEEKRNLSLYTKTSESYRLVFFNRDGKAFWSTNPSKIGKGADGDYFKDIIQAGGIYALIVMKQASEIEGRLSDPKVLKTRDNSERYVNEIYVPVIENGEFLGAIEHYRDVTNEVVLHRSHLRALGIVGGSVLWLISGIIVWQVTRSARQREADLKTVTDMQRQVALTESKRVRESRLLSELNEWLQACKSLDELYDMVATFLAKLMPKTSGSLYIYANSRDVLDGVKAWNHRDDLHAIQPDDCWGLRRGRTYSYGQNEIDFVCGHVHGPAGSYCCIPIVAHGETIGLLHLVFSHVQHCATGGNDCVSCAVPCEEERRLALICAEQISLAIANVRLREQLRDQSIRDPLTGLFNRRYMLETCRRELARARRSGEAVSFFSLDVDHFKRFNDHHGHDAGDTVLRTIGECLRSSLREDDVACRMGGEEFVMVLPSTTLEAAEQRAEELRQRVESLVIRYADANLPRVTVSIGIASFPSSGVTPQEVLNAADKALYAAKAEGRNCVRLSGSSKSSETTGQELVTSGRPREVNATNRHRPGIERAEAEARSSAGPQENDGAGDGNRTHVLSLEGSCSTIELHPRQA